jgi:L-amino acid N-acyltransferase YncA
VNPPVTIRQAVECDAPALAQIYNHYVLTSVATFETEVVDSQEMSRRVCERLEKHDWLVATVDGRIVGYAYYGAFRPRAAYSHTVESTVYVAAEAVGQGFGHALYHELIDSAEAKGFAQMIGVIALPNAPSIALHERLGFNEAGVLREVGFKLGRFVDVSLWQRANRKPAT